MRDSLQEKWSLEERFKIKTALYCARPRPVSANVQYRSTDSTAASQSVVKNNSTLDLSFKETCAYSVCCQEKIAPFSEKIAVRKLRSKWTCYYPLEWSFLLGCGQLSRRQRRREENVVRDEQCCDPCSDLHCHRGPSISLNFFDDNAVCIEIIDLASS